MLKYQYLNLIGIVLLALDVLTYDVYDIFFIVYKVNDFWNKLKIVSIYFYYKVSNKHLGRIGWRWYCLKVSNHL